jgi:hypothetical protein
MHIGTNMIICIKKHLYWYVCMWDLLHVSWSVGKCIYTLQPFIHLHPWITLSMCSPLDLYMHTSLNIHFSVMFEINGLIYSCVQELFVLCVCLCQWVHIPVSTVAGMYGTFKCLGVLYLWSWIYTHKIYLLYLWFMCYYISVCLRRILCLCVRECAHLFIDLWDSCKVLYILSWPG